MSSAQRTQRFCELQDALGGANSATLSQRLKLLEDEGLIDRRAVSETPPWVEYSLTHKGADLRRAIAGIDRWADRWASLAVSHPVAEERPVEHGDALNLVRTIVAEAPGPDAAAQRVVEALHDRFGALRLGRHLLAGRRARELVLGPWIGPEATEHTRIPVGVGICGAAAESGQTEIVDDVNADPRYLACFATTAVRDRGPHLRGGPGHRRDRHRRLRHTAAYDDTDARFLEEVAALLAPAATATGA